MPAKVDEAFYSFHYEATLTIDFKNNATCKFSGFYVPHSALTATFRDFVTSIATTESDPMTKTAKLIPADTQNVHSSQLSFKSGNFSGYFGLSN